MSMKKSKCAAFFLIDSEDYKTFSELRNTNLELQKQIAELMKYKDMHSNAENSHLQTKVTDLEKKLRQHSAVTTEPLNPSEAQTSDGGQVGSGSRDINLSSEDQFKNKLFTVFKSFMESQQNQFGAGLDTTPLLAVPIHEEPLGSSAEFSSNKHSVLESEANQEPQENSTNTVLDTFRDRLLNSVPASQKAKACQLLDELKKFSSDIAFEPSGAVKLNNQELPESNIFNIFPLLYKPIKNYEENLGLAQIVDEITSLGLGHLILRHYTLGITPQGKNYLKNRHELRKNLSSAKPWYYLHKDD